MAMTQLAQNHPDARTLSDFAAGLLSDADAEMVAGHLGSCASCIAAIDNAPADTVVSLVRVVLTDASSAATQAFDRSGMPSPDALPMPRPLREQKSYQVLELLGSGGMGTVYKAMHLVTERTVALKVIQQDLLAQPAARARFLREAKALSKLNHPNIVHVHHVEEMEDLIVVVMEYLEGDSLAQVVQARKALPLAEACRYVMEAARGLQHAHELGLIHRDIKPDNLRLGSNGEVKVVDFGLVRSVDGGQTEQSLTGANAILGTPAYMAPEQAVDSTRATVQSDLYALGCTFFCLLTGEPPFRGRTMMEVLLKHAHDQPPPLKQWRDDVTPDVQALLRQMLAKDIAHRPPSAQAVAATLEGILGRLDMEKQARAHASSRKLRGLIYGTLLAMAFLGAVAATVFFFQTRHGVVRVEIDDDDIEAVITKTGATIKKADGEKDIVLAPADDHMISVKRGGLELFTTTFALKKGKKTVLKVDMLPGEVRLSANGIPIYEKKLPAPDSPAKIAGAPLESPDRKAAEWVLSVGGKVTVVYDGVEYEIEGGRSLPPGEIKLVHVNLNNNKKLGDFDLAKLKGLSHLTELHVGTTLVSNSGLIHVKGLTGLRFLGIGHTSISDAGLVHLKELKELLHLGAYGSMVTRSGLEQLKGVPKLTVCGGGGNCLTSDSALIQLKTHFNDIEWLPIHGADISAAGLALLKDFPKLRKLELHGAFTDARLASLPNLDSVSVLEIGSTEITANGLKHLRRFANLRELWLDCAMLNGASIEHLKELPKLAVMRLFHVPPTGKGLEQLQHLPNLSMLNLNDNREIRGAALSQLKGIAKLNVLWLSNTSVDDAGLEYLSDLKTLGWLLIRTTKVTAAGVKKLKAKLPDCNIEWDGDTSSAKPGDREVAEWVLSLGGAVIVSVDSYEQEIGPGKALPPGEIKLLEINFVGNQNLTNAKLARLDGLRHLRDLVLGRTHVSDSGLVHLKSLRGLLSIGLGMTSVSDEGLMHLKELPNLIFVGLGGTRVTREGANQLSKSLPHAWIRLDGVNILTDARLEHIKRVSRASHMVFDSLDFSFSQVTDSGLIHCKDFPELKSINLSNTQITDFGLKHLTGFTNLTRLEIANSAITGAGLENLKGLTKLQFLMLDPKQLSGVEHLKGLYACGLHVTNLQAKGTGLERLKNVPFHMSFLGLANNPSLGDAGLVHMKGHPNLRDLWLINTGLTDAGLKHLQELTKLRHVELQHNRLTEAGVKKLAEKLPRCRIIWDQGEIPPRMSLAVQSNSMIRRFQGHTAGVVAVALSTDGRLVITGSQDKSAILWDAASGKKILSLDGHTDSVESVALSGDGKLALTGSKDSTATLWDTPNGKSIRTFKGHKDKVWNVALSRDGKRALTGSADATAILWDTASGDQLRIFKGHTRDIASVALSEDGRFALTGSLDTTAILWSTATGAKIQTFEGHMHAVEGVALIGDKRVLTASRDYTAALWEISSGKKLQTFVGHADTVFSVAPSRDGKYVLTASEDQSAALWETANGQKIQTFLGHTDLVWNAALSEDGKFVVTASKDKTAILWAVGGK